jgi:hypothetical protein
MPRRLHRKHFRERMPPGSRGVARPARWGNPHDWRTLGRAEAVRRFEYDLAQHARRGAQSLAGTVAGQGSLVLLSARPALSCGCVVALGQ